MYRQFKNIPFNRFQALIQTECPNSEFSSTLGSNCIGINNYIRRVLRSMGIPNFTIHPVKGYHTGILLGSKKDHFYSQTDGMLEPQDISSLIQGELFDEIQTVSLLTNQLVTLTLRDWNELGLSQTLRQKNKPPIDFDQRTFNLEEISDEYTLQPIEYIRSDQYKLRLSIIHQGKRLILGVDENKRIYIKFNGQMIYEDDPNYKWLFKTIANRLKRTPNELRRHLNLAIEIQSS